MVAASRAISERRIHYWWHVARLGQFPGSSQQKVTVITTIKKQTTPTQELPTPHHCRVSHACYPQFVVTFGAVSFFFVSTRLGF